MHETISFIASSAPVESPLAIVAFAIGAFGFYIYMDRKDKEHEVKMKKLEQKKKQE